MNLIARLQRVADAYCAAASLRLEQASYQIFRDQRRLSAVFGGQRGLTVASYESAMLWFAENWPTQLEWPEGIERPVSGTDEVRPATHEHGAAA